MIALVNKEINQLKERKKDNGSWHTSINNYRNTFSIFYKYNLNDWINKSIILVRNYTYNSFGYNFYKPHEKMIYKLLKKFSSWLDYKLWRHELKLKIKRHKQEGDLWKC